MKMKKLKERCDKCGREFGFFTKKFSSTIFDGRRFLTVFLCAECYRRNQMKK